MRIIVAIILLLLPVSVFAQREESEAAIGTARNFTAQGGALFAGALGDWNDIFNTGYNPTQVQTDDLFLDAAGRMYRVAVISGSTFFEVSVTLESLESVPVLPVGRGVVWRPMGNKLIPPLPDNNGEITSYLQSLILVHNFRRTAQTAGGQVDQITTLADTATIMEPAEGHILIKADSTIAAFYDADLGKWLFLTGGGGGGGGDDWGAQTVDTDATLTGDGTPGATLGVNTATIATRQHVETEILANGLRQITYTATGGESTVVIPFQIDNTKPMVFNRNGVGLSIGSGKNVTLSGTTFTINLQPLDAGEEIKILLYEN
ncbi:hypothetical protein [Lewinella sp. W8]|uniref:hypothetical protein n=1 Tax=Lewinella sp. W8 TaxID=2528208 RepID=UPI00106804AE|nr:hypothetical protein [Lewinella sp. W8]MTB53042.1 hypothetical protein [Lewinella sp. W8]